MKITDFYKLISMQDAEIDNLKQELNKKSDSIELLLMSLNRERDISHKQKEELEERKKHEMALQTEINNLKREMEISYYKECETNAWAWDAIKQRGLHNYDYNLPSNISDSFESLREWRKEDKMSKHLEYQYKHPNIETIKNTNLINKLCDIIRDLLKDRENREKELKLANDKINALQFNIANPNISYITVPPNWLNL